jgi:hypothetical protein
MKSVFVHNRFEPDRPKEIVMFAKASLSRCLFGAFLVLLILLTTLFLPQTSLAQADHPVHPAQPVKLIFIHHSTGENWLTDGYGDLGRTLAENNYFVSDTNYGWGPDSIGDRTDIPDWMEWFRSEQTPTYMAALFSESGQHASYTRTFGDPGGENVIILFKSCFPNSALEGGPNDPPDPAGWLSVGHAKYVYNEILQYFATRPDKLFIVITAPPLSDGSYAANARAFNNWLLNDWLDENDYALNNVAVFDFYNILTSPDAHHRYVNGQIEHAATSRNTLAYPSGDDHPSEQGSRKATDEFIGLLNFYYQRWQASAPQQPVAPRNPGASEPEPAATGAAPALSLDTIDNFEAACQISSSGWQAYWDEATSTRFTCAAVNGRAHGGANSLQVDYDLASESWATCDLSFDQAQNWASAEGISFYLSAEQAGQTFNVDIYTGSADARATYAAAITTPADGAAGWTHVSLRWSDFHRVAWEENPDAAFASPDAILGIAFGFSESQAGAIWIDDITLLQGESPATIPEAAPATASAPAVDSPGQPGSRPCASSLAAPLALIGFIAWQRRHKHDDKPRDR